MLERRVAAWWVCAAVSCASIVLVGQQSPQQPAPPPFRSATSLVPIDVRVVDRAGDPVTNLKAADFTVLENGVRQEIRHFSTESFTAGTAGVVPAPVGTIANPAPLGSQTRRVFLIVLGRGRLQPPGGGVDGMLHLVRDRLLPQDLVAVVLWNRATRFTIDHAAITALLERFKKAHEGIETDLSEWFSGLRAMFGSREIPPFIQAKINDVFGDAPGAAPRSLGEVRLPDADRMADDQRRMIDRMISDQLAGQVAALGQDAEPFVREILGPSNALDGLTLDAMAAINTQSMQDLNRIYAGIQFMRSLDGEKHLIFVSPEGVFLPSADDDHSLAAAAADARIALDIVHTGGVSGTVFDWRIPTSKTAAEETGGSYTGLSSARSFVDRLDAATRFQYVLGYYPTNPALDGKLRHITVRVNRPGVTVQYRRGYFSRREPGPLDRARMQPYERVAAAAMQPREIHDLTLSVEASNAAGPGMDRQVQVDIKLLPNRLVFTERDGKQTGSLEVAIFCADSRERLIGQSWNTVDLNMTPEVFERLKATGFALNGHVSVTAPARFVKVVIYDAGSDLVGSAIVRMK